MFRTDISRCPILRNSEALSLGLEELDGSLVRYQRLSWTVIERQVSGLSGLGSPPLSASRVSTCMGESSENGRHRSNDLHQENLSILNSSAGHIFDGSLLTHAGSGKNLPQ